MAVRTAWAIAAVALVGFVAVFGPVNPAAPATGGSPILAASTVSCTGHAEQGDLKGTLTIVGGPLPSAYASGVALNFTYLVTTRTFNASSGKLIATGCQVADGSTTTGANGTFVIRPALLEPTCMLQGSTPVCTTYGDPRAPVNVSVVGGAPVGYGISIAQTSTRVYLAFVYELSSASIDPTGSTVTTSVGAPTTLTAAAWAANGSASPLSVGFAWSLNGTGWSVRGGTDAATLVVVAAPGAGVGTATVRVSPLDDPGGPPPVSASASLVAEATAIDFADENRTTLDVGGAVTIDVAAVGAASLPYRASIQPGLGLPSVAASCASSPFESGELSLSCNASVVYPAAGVADPTANVTNGYSTADWSLPELTVAPLPVLEVGPASPAGYAGTPIELTLTAANATGARPFSSACVDLGSGAPECDSGPGPSWPFSVTFLDPGTFAVTAWARDAAGTNASTAVSVTVAEPLGVGNVTAPDGNVTAGAPAGLVAGITGGVLPLRYWWNLTGSSAPLASGTLAADGPITATLVAASAGPVEVTLTVADRLGTVVRSSTLIVVDPAAASRVALTTTGPATPVAAGTPVPLGWTAFDLAGEVDRSFTANLDLVLSTDEGGPPPAVAWVNASGTGPLEPLTTGKFGVPASAWVGGVLNVTLTVGTAGTVTATLVGAGLPAGSSSTTFSVDPDRAQVRLFDPEVRESGGRVNATLWSVEDRFGNPAPGAVLTLEIAWTGQESDRLVSAIALPGGGSGVWINYSAPSVAAGTITVVDAAGQTVLGPLTIPPPPGSPSSSATVDAVATGVPAGTVAVVAFVVVRRRRQVASAASEDDLRTLAEGQAKAAELLERLGEADLAELEAAWRPRPAPPALAGWIATLVADGTLSAKIGADGRARFRLATPRPSAPRVTLDPEALARSLEQRDAALGGAADDEPLD